MRSLQRTHPTPGTVSGPSIEVDSVRFTVDGRDLLREVSFTLRPGSLTALVGPNGAGKSTLLSLLAGDTAPTQGSVHIAGRAATAWPARTLARLRAVMLQRHESHFGFSVAESVSLGRLPHDADRELDRRIVARALHEADLGHMRGRDVTTLSGGEAARVAFARSSAQAAPVLLLDEPTAALDLHHQEAVLSSARSRRDAGETVVVVLHDLNLAARYADRMLILADGELVADGSPAEVISRESMRKIYGQEVHLLKHPDTGAPVIVPVGP